MSESEQATIVTEDILGDLGFRVQFSYRTHWCDVTAWKIDGRDEFERPIFSNGIQGWQTDHAGGEPYLKGFVKWDGCTELDQGCNHWCGPDDYQATADLLRFIYERAMELMESGEAEEWPAARKPNPRPVV